MPITCEARWPTLPEESNFRIAKPVLGLHRGVMVSAIAHLQSYQMPLLHSMSWGTAEATTGTFRFLAQLHPNCGAVFFSFLPRGTTDSGAPYNGTLAVASAAWGSPRDIGVRTVDVADLGDLAIVDTRFIREFGSPSFIELTYTVTDVLLHSVEVYQVPRFALSGAAQDYVYRSYEDSTEYINDNNSAADPRGRTFRGEPAMLEQVQQAKRNMARHWTPYVLTGVTVNPGLNNTWTDVPGFDDLYMRGRAVKGSATVDRMDTRSNVYVSAIGAGTTWQFRIVGTDTSAASANLVAPTTGWWLSIASLASGLAHTLRSDAVDTVKLQVQRTVGAGSITINGLSDIEEALIP